MDSNFNLLISLSIAYSNLSCDYWRLTFNYCADGNKRKSLQNSRTVDNESNV